MSDIWHFERISGHIDTLVSDIRHIERIGVHIDPFVSDYDIL